MGMLENIRRIGIFMIAAQTVMHFAAGKQYEKYMKMIAGVIVLLQFVSPFVASAGDITAKWQEEAEKMWEQTELLSSEWQSEPYTGNYAETVALRQIEREVKARLNEMIADREFYIEAITIDLQEIDQNVGFWTNAGEDGLEFKCIRITLRRQPDKEMEIQDKSPVGKISEIQIEEITIEEKGKSAAEYEEKQDSAYDMTVEEYRRLFAKALGIKEDRVEVSYYGGQ